jgi:hypothetical protein
VAPPVKGCVVIGDHGGTLAAARQALAISPNYAIAHQQLGTAIVVFRAAARGAQWGRLELEGASCTSRA